MTQSPERGAPSQATATGTSKLKPDARYFTLILLTIIYALNFLDRTIFNVLIEPIKKEFALSDTTIGLLAGFGFVFLYSVLGMPIARLADRVNRRNIVTLGLAFWSVMTALCGLAQNVATLAAARVGVGIGESAGTPASQSLVTDLFTRDERPRALGIYAMGTYFGIFMGYFFGGWVSQHYGWRAAFLSAGLPGLALALILWAMVREPVRGASDGNVTPQVRESIKPTLRFMVSQRSYVLVLIGFCFTTFTNYATSVWIPPFLSRIHQLQPSDVGFYAGTFKGLFGMAGTLLGGLVVAHISRNDDRWKLWAPALMSIAAAPALAACLLTTDLQVSVVMLGLFSLLVGFHLGPIFAIGQTVVRPNMRAFASASLLLTATCFGQGVGPLVVGALNDYLKAEFGVVAIRYSLLAAALTTVLGGFLFLAAARSIRKDIKRAESSA
jgi:predicted MFS family arabinose efflux permease